MRRSRVYGSPMIQTWNLLEIYIIASGHSRLDKVFRVTFRDPHINIPVYHEDGPFKRQLADR